jgi:hypothetical protein
MAGELAYQAVTKIKTEKWLVAEAAWMVREWPTINGWRPEQAYATGSLLDELVLHWVDLPGQVQQAVLRTCRELTGERERAGRASLRSHRR